MATSLRHELRAPLNHILAHCDLLIDETGRRKLSRFLPDLHRIQTAGRRLFEVIGELFEPAEEEAPGVDERVVHHEIWTPLHQILGYAEWLEEEALEQSLPELVADIRRLHAATHELLTLVVKRFSPHRGRTASTNSAESDATDAAESGSARDAPSAKADAAVDGEVSRSAGRLLVVDDNALSRAMLARELKALGHEVDEAEHGESALARLREATYDLVLLDLMMPVLNGYELLQRMRAHPAWRSVPVIVLSAADDSRRIRRCLELGAEDYLRKPFDPVLLRVRIKASLERRAWRERESLLRHRLEEEEKRNSDLLRVVLPENVAEELETTQGVETRRLDRAGVLLCDVVGFTSFSQEHSPDIALRHWQSLVEMFELIALQHGLEKVRTFGDAFLGVSGLAAVEENAALNCVRCGLTMVGAARSLPPHWSLRVGVQAGPVMAGVVGQRKFQFDVWGDTVGKAARWVRRAEPDTVCVSATAWPSLRDHCEGRSLGVVPVPGRGEQELFLITNLLP